MKNPRDKAKYNEWKRNDYKKDPEKYAINARKQYMKDPAKRIAACKVWQRSTPERTLLRSAKQRAKNRGLDFDIQLSDVVIPPACPVLGIPLIPFSGKFSHNSPSIDRIDNTKGYVKGNVIVVSFRANSLKKDATPKELRAIAEFYTRLEEKNE